MCSVYHRNAPDPPLRCITLPVSIGKHISGGTTAVETLVSAHNLFLPSLPQGKLASFFLSRLDALNPQLQQVKGREKHRAQGL